MTNQVLIVGASTRAAAFSALRAGLKPRCVDNFADRDVGEVFPVLRAAPGDGVAALEAAAHESSGGPWLYIGPIENHPDMVSRISRSHHLLGNPPEILRAVRNPVCLADVLRRHGLSRPEVRLSREGLPRDGTWLEKPVASGGGRLIRPLEQARGSLSEPTYFQERIEGGCFSALFIASRGEASRARFSSKLLAPGHSHPPYPPFIRGGKKRQSADSWEAQSKTALIGVTRQLIGAPGSPFAYRGSIGPVTISQGLKARLDLMGRVLASEFALVGLFGVDYILSDDEPWAVEVNPRYTASVEVLELALRRSLMAEHLWACDVDRLAANDASATGAALPAPRVVGKAIIYASRSLVTPDIPIDDAWRDDAFAVPTVADVPWPATRIDAGQPVMSVFSIALDVTECGARLERLIQTWQERLQD